MEKYEILDRLDAIHNILAKSNLSTSTYNEVSNIIVHLKEDLRNDNRILVENCEHHQHDHCDCMGKYCLSSK